MLPLTITEQLFSLSVATVLKCDLIRQVNGITSSTGLHLDRGDEIQDFSSRT